MGARFCTRGLVYATETTRAGDVCGLSVLADIAKAAGMNLKFD
jgi:hypothetical protein